MNQEDGPLQIDQDRHGKFKISLSKGVTDTFNKRQVEWVIQLFLDAIPEDAPLEWVDMAALKDNETRPMYPMQNSGDPNIVMLFWPMLRDGERVLFVDLLSEFDADADAEFIKSIKDVLPEKI